jgi:hypothetical protein
MSKDKKKIAIICLMAFIVMILWFSMALYNNEKKLFE